MKDQTGGLDTVFAYCLLQEITQIKPQRLSSVQFMYLLMAPSGFIVSDVAASAQSIGL